MDGEACKHSDTSESIGTCKQWCTTKMYYEHKFTQFCYS